jgi:hypothetical protein
MYKDRYHARTLGELGDELIRLQERIRIIDRDMSEDAPEASHRVRGELSDASLSLRHAHSAIARARRI